MMKETFLLVLIQIIALATCAIFQTPNKDDREYWHNYNIKYLNKILSSQKPTKDSAVAKNVILFVGDG